MRSLLCFLSVAIFFSGCSGSRQPVAELTANVAETMTLAPLASSGDGTAPNNEDVTNEPLIVDVRSLQEWEGGHLTKAVHIPHTEIAAQIGQYATDKNAKIVLYCAKGGRAGMAKEALEQLGFLNVENAGGLSDAAEKYEPSLK